MALSAMLPFVWHGYTTKWSGIQMLSEFRTLKSLVFRCFLYSDSDHYRTLTVADLVVVLCFFFKINCNAKISTLGLRVIDVRDAINLNIN